MGYTKELALLFMMVLFVAHFSPGDAWWGRRRRRRCHTPHKPAGKHWANNWDHRMHFQCPLRQSISSIYSIYSTCHRDRVWSFGCRYNPSATTGCSWGYYANEWDGLLNFHCPPIYSGSITGVRSHHSNHHEDRRFRFRCCTNPAWIKYECKTTPFYQNSWRGILNFHVPHGFYLTGATSVHNNGQEDRRWQFEYCKIKPRRRGDEPKADEAAKENGEEEPNNKVDAAEDLPNPEIQDKADDDNPQISNDIPDINPDTKDEDLPNPEIQNKADDDNPQFSDDIPDMSPEENTEENAANAEEDDPADNME